MEESDAPPGDPAVLFDDEPIPALDSKPAINSPQPRRQTKNKPTASSSRHGPGRRWRKIKDVLSFMPHESGSGSFLILIVGMKPKPRPESSQLDLIQAQFEQLLNHSHPLFVLANKIDRSRFETALADFHSPVIGAPAKSTRLLVGLHYLQHAFNGSDDSLLDRIAQLSTNHDTAIWPMACRRFDLFLISG